VTIRDDAGSEVPLYRWTREDADDPNNAGLADAIMRAGEATQRTGWNIKITRKDLWMAVPGLVVIFTAVGTQLFWPSAPPWTLWIVMPAVMIPVMRIVARGHLRDHSGLFAATLLANRRCASCGYLLEGATADEAGFLRCPECSAVWMASRIGSVRITPPASGRGVVIMGDDPFRQGANMGYIKPWSARAQWNRTAAVVDAKKRSLPLVRRAELRAQVSARQGASAADNVLGDWRRETRWHAAWTTLWVLFLVLVVGLFLWQSVQGRAGGSTFMLVAALIVGVTTLPYWAAQLRRTYAGQAQHTAKRVAQLLVNNAICPACGGELDAERRCGCGAEWPKVFPQG
jgi:hypothetical protein